MTHESQDYIQILRDKGYRVTPQRLIVLDAICEISGHADLGQVTAQVKYFDPTIDKSTVYRALDVLCAVGLVIETDLDKQGKVYCIAGDNPHHHLTCQSCGSVMTVPDDEFQHFQHQILDKYGFAIQSEHLAFKGVCKACQQ